MRASDPRYLSALLALTMTQACDCEARVRQYISGRGDEARLEAVAKAEQVSGSLTELEPNDQREQATALALTRELRAIRGALQSPTDVDWYALSLDVPDGPWLIELTAQPDEAPGLDLALELVGQGQPAAARYQIEGVDAAEVIPMVALGKTPLLLGVRAHTGQGAYTLQLKRRLSQGAVEAEPNDTAALAWPLRAPGELQGIYDRPGDRDVFEVQLPDPAPLAYTVQLTGVEGLGQTLEIAHAPDREATLTLFAPAGEAVEVPNLTMPQGATRAWAALSAGQGYSRERAYSLRWLVHPPLPDGEVLELEPNDSAEQAQRLMAPGFAKGYLHDAADVDHWQVQFEAPLPDALPDAPTGAPVPAPVPPPAAPSGVLTPDALIPDEPTPGAGQEERPAPLILAPRAPKAAPGRLIDARLRPLKPALKLELGWRWSVAGGSAQDEVLAARAPGEVVTLCRRAVSSLAYPVTVRALAGVEAPRKSGLDYALELVEHAASPGMDVEPNDTLASADALTVGAPIQGYIARAGDIDTYALELAEPPERPDAYGRWRRKVAVKLGAHPLDLVLKLLDQDGVVLDEVNARGASGAESLTLELPMGRYFVQVSAHDPAAQRCEPYTLSVEAPLAP